MNGLGKTSLVGLLLLLMGTLATAAAETPVPVTTLVPPAQMRPWETVIPITVRPYAIGDSGADVLAFKQRMQVLGYFRQGTTLSNKMTETTLERLNQLLSDNGMEPVEVITAEIQAMVFERDDLAIIPPPTPSPIPELFLMPKGTPELPMLDSEGFLLDAGGEYVFADEADGLWYYISHDLYINIRRYNDRQEDNIWFESQIKTRGGEHMRSFLTETLHTYRRPVTIARENKAVLAFTDDYFVRREYGVVIRDRVIYCNSIRTSSKTYPLGDTLAVFADGSMRAYDYSAYTAQEYLEMGAVHVLSFGPWLIRDGVINERVLANTYMPYREPRNAIGMIAPGHYVVITANGRYEGAKGVYIGWMAKRMLEIGVTQAINLDGGGTTALTFMGLQLSRVSSARSDGKNTRKVSSMMGFGVSEAVEAP